jgi:hypothetical protein
MAVPARLELATFGLGNRCLAQFLKQKQAVSQPHRLVSPGLIECFYAC